MSKRPRPQPPTQDSPPAPTPLPAPDQRSVVEQAIDRVAGHRQAPDDAGAPLRAITLPVLPTAMRLQPGQAFDLTAPEDEEMTALLVVDARHGAWRAVMLPPGSTWKLAMKRTGPNLWKPGDELPVRPS